MDNEFRFLEEEIIPGNGQWIWNSGRIILVNMWGIWIPQRGNNAR
jgi:hypothetical protein